MTRVSVVVLNYNYARFLPDAVHSALTQTHPDVEVVVVDDASTDNSRAVIEGFGPSLTAVYHATNQGQGAAINSGAAQATGEVVWFLDADDALLPTACEEAARAFGLTPGLAKFHTSMAVVDGAGRRVGEVRPSDPERLAAGDLVDHVLRYRSHGWPPMSGNAFSADALKRVLPVPAETYRQAADSFLCEQVAICGPIARACTPVALYRVHGSNQFAGRPTSLEWLRTKLTREVESHRRLGLVAQELGIEEYDPDPTVARDVAFCGYRMASLRIDPAGHPGVGHQAPDTRSRLALQGVIAAWTNPRLVLLDRLLRTAWFVAMAVVPARLVPTVLRCYLPDGAQAPIWSRWKGSVARFVAQLRGVNRAPIAC